MDAFPPCLGFLVVVVGLAGGGVGEKELSQDLPGVSVLKVGAASSQGRLQ